MKIYNCKLKIARGFSLIEVLVFVTILSLFFVAASSVSIVSLRNLKSNENKILATRYAEELVDWLSGEKEDDWNIFYNKSSNAGTVYCFNNLVITWPASGACASYGLSAFFKREATLKRGLIGSDPKIDVTVDVSWSEASQTLKVPIKTIFTRFE